MRIREAIVVYRNLTMIQHAELLLAIKSNKNIFLHLKVTQEKKFGGPHPKLKPEKKNISDERALNSRTTLTTAMDRQKIKLSSKTPQLISQSRIWEYMLLMKKWHALQLGKNLTRLSRKNSKNGKSCLLYGSFLLCNKTGYIPEMVPVVCSNHQL